MKNMLAFVFLGFIHLVACGAEAGGGVGWGKDVCGGSMSISTSNTVVRPGSAVTLSCRFRNSSTNIIALNLPPPPRYFLTNSSGQLYELRNPTRLATPVLGNFNRIVRLQTGEAYQWSLTLEIGKDVPPGGYELRSARSFLVVHPEDYQRLLTTDGVSTLRRQLNSSDGTTYEIQSNAIRIRIVR